MAQPLTYDRRNADSGERGNSRSVKGDHSYIRSRAELRRDRVTGSGVPDAIRDGRASM
jgi:hypothetical protein